MSGTDETRAFGYKDHVALQEASRLRTHSFTRRHQRTDEHASSEPLSTPVHNANANANTNTNANTNANANVNANANANPSSHSS